MKSMKNNIIKYSRQIEELARSILTIGGLVKPILIMDNRIGQYELIAGEMEYCADSRGNEISPLKGEMINAFITQNDAEEQLYKEQLLKLFDAGKLDNSQKIYCIKSYNDTVIVKGKQNKITPTRRYLVKERFLVETGEDYIYTDYIRNIQDERYFSMVDGQGRNEWLNVSMIIRRYIISDKISV